MGIGTTGYNLLNVLHILCAVVAFGPLFLYPALQRAGATAQIAKLHLFMVIPAMVLLWVFGMGLVGMSDDAFEMTDVWVAGALVVWLVALGTSVFLIRPALSEVGDAARSKLAAGTGVTHLMLVIALYFMVFKP
ncbi:MAG: hypothetical protein R2704_17840 [Microthrixaceae bacterium]